VNALTVVAVAIIVAGTMLLLASVFTLGAEQPRAAARERAPAVPVKLWCPLASEVTRVGLGVDPGGSGLSVVWCDRFTGGPIECDRACLPSKAAA
jgi:hypothetical protein